MSPSALKEPAARVTFRTSLGVIRSREDSREYLVDLFELVRRIRGGATSSAKASTERCSATKEERVVREAECWCVFVLID